MTETPISKHSPTEDAQAFVLGTALAAFAVTMLTHLGLITGQTAGLAVLLSYVTGWSFGAVFFMVNLPFYLLAWVRMGPAFTLKSFVCVAMVSAMTELFPQLITFDTLDPILGALLIGGITGLGLIVLFRHGASLGGVGVLALYLQDRTGFRAGYTQLVFDLVLFAAAFFVLAPMMVIYSLLGAVVANLIIATNHRADRYTGR
ncbi:YitT family protein [Thalassorhabdomicrobium marinisediminis]|uniref:YitT family protein n=1 Tax=Thalassorhabdomicrobium marinisediminis TaxID=2170577 RepID=A0A2T7G1H0_9RHOB|nr:YitT family protein [Thalassorhabdomicrobium marinisediminis]PVA08254.1 YitT family protein [Thalassorhabdomicrobium marinisediminis]